MLMAAPIYEISRKSLGVELFRADRQTDMMKMIVAFGYCLFGSASLTMVIVIMEMMMMMMTTTTMTTTAAAIKTSAVWG